MQYVIVKFNFRFQLNKVLFQQVFKNYLIKQPVFQKFGKLFKISRIFRFFFINFGVFFLTEGAFRRVSPVLPINVGKNEN